MSDNTSPGGAAPSGFGRPPARASEGSDTARSTDAAGSADTRSGSNPVTTGSDRPVTTGSDRTQSGSGSSASDKARDLFGSARSKVSQAAKSAAAGATAARSSSSADGDTRTDARHAKGTSKDQDLVPGASAGAAKKAASGARRTRKARLRLSRIDPWSVMKTSFLFGIAGGIIFFISVWVLWGVIVASGVFESVNRAVNDLLATPGAADKFHLEDFINGNRVLGFAAMIGAADVVIFTALATLFSFLYNLAATVMGGLEVTLAED